MKSIMRYPGGKSKVQDVILKYAPNFSEYREPFVGGGGVFFGITRSKCQKRWINDCNPDLISVYEALNEPICYFIEDCMEIPSADPDEPKVPTKEKGKPYNKRLGEKFQELLKERKVNPALSYFFINRTVWAGRVNYSIPSRLYYSNPEGWNIVNTTKLRKARNHIYGTRITCGDYSVLLEESGEGVWVYCDPPYVTNTKMVKTDQQYEYNFTLEDHEKFVDSVKKCEHDVCISYDDCDEVREWFKDPKFTIHNEKWTYSGSSLSEKKTGMEVVITNY